MADKIKKFFEKKKVEAKFKMAGPGHKLTESKKPTTGGSGKSGAGGGAPSRANPSVEARQAGAAALARLGGEKRDTPAFNTSLAAIQAQVKRELEAEKKAAMEREEREKSGTPPSEPPPPSEPEDMSPLLAVRGVYFKCPLVGPEILSKDEWKGKIKEFLYEQLADEKGLTACLIIHSCNKNKDKVEQCIETLSKYLENIIKNPDEEKYRKIRLSNRIFQEKVAGLEGVMEFLEAAGFRQETLPFQEREEPFLVFDVSVLQDLENLQVLMDALHSAEPIGLELDRNVQVLLPTQAAQKTELPPAFFTMTPDEVKREQQLRTERVESSLVLRTKAMREKEEQREMKKYRFALIRVRFPDGILLQGTFGVYEKLSEVFTFVQEHIVFSEGEFVLTTGTGHRLTEADMNKTLLELHLVPASILLFVWAGETPSEDYYLKPEVMLQLQSL
ncbi:UBX domain-containing protein 6 [Homalodisca vitripennis]|nr:UBX domain-containing protein 6 [Homalodisca vitripennis]XP_046661138.1 UBX domain-containing protein 6 [Homalodisca vitripennis]